MSYYVSRQCYWPDSDNVVEIASSGLDYANPDMLADQHGRYKRLTGEYVDPREALEAAIYIRSLWNVRLRPDEQCRIEHGFTGGNTMPFCDEPTDDELREWAQHAYDETPKCDHCGGIVIERFEIWDYPDFVFCSDYCAEEAWQQEEEEVKE